MKNKSFLFLIAVLAMGLALFGCSSDSDSSTEYRDLTYVGKNDAESIMEALERGNVYLTADTDLTPPTPLLIPTNRTLFVNGQTVKVGSLSVIIGAGKLDWSGTDDPTGTDSKIEAGSIGAVLINIDPDITHYGSAGVFDAEGTASFTFVPLDEVKSAGGVNYFASNKSASIFNSGGSLATGAGTTAYFIGSHDAKNNSSGVFNTNNGTLVVTGDLTGLKTLTTATPLKVYNKLGGGTDSALADFITGGGTIEVKTADFTGGKISNILNVSGNGDFTKPVDFAGTLTLTGKATFSDNVTFTAPGKITQQAVFAKGKKVSGKAEVGIISFTGTGTSNTLVLDANGQIIYTSISPGPLTSSGTLATLDGGGSIALTFDTNKLTIDGQGAVGSFAVYKDISLTGSNEIEVKGSAAVKFESGTIVASNYKLGGTIDAVTSNEGFVLTKDSIKKITGAAATPTVTLGTTKGILLTLNTGSTATIDGVNIALTSGGSISVSSGNLIITGGGSVSAGNLAWGGTIAGTATAAGGSLLVGSLSAANTGTNKIPAGSIQAGSIGTQATTPGVIIGNSVFIFTDATVVQGIGSTGVGDGGSASSGGSILVFGHN
jgi:hypothetical protein